MAAKYFPGLSQNSSHRPGKTLRKTPPNKLATLESRPAGLEGSALRLPYLQTSQLRSRVAAGNLNAARGKEGGARGGRGEAATGVGWGLHAVRVGRTWGGRRQIFVGWLAAGRSR